MSPEDGDLQLFRAALLDELGRDLEATIGYDRALRAGVSPQYKQQARFNKLLTHLAVLGYQRSPMQAVESPGLVPEVEQAMRDFLERSDTPDPLIEAHLAGLLLLEGHDDEANLWLRRAAGKLDHDRDAAELVSFIQAWTADEIERERKQLLWTGTETTFTIYQSERGSDQRHVVTSVERVNGVRVQKRTVQLCWFDSGVKVCEDRELRGKPQTIEHCTGKGPERTCLFRRFTHCWTSSARVEGDTESDRASRVLDCSDVTRQCEAYGDIEDCQRAELVFGLSDVRAPDDALSSDEP